MSTSNEIVIVGGGPAGMFLAYQLATNGVPVRVLEKHIDFGREFRGEVLQASALQFLKQLGLLRELTATGQTLGFRRFVTHLGEKPLLKIEPPQGGEIEEAAMLVAQQALLETLHRSCSRYPNYRLERNARVLSPIIDQDKVIGLNVRHDAYSEKVLCPLVVACDGRNSVLRKHPDVRVEVLESLYNDLWLRFDVSRRPDVVPDGVHIYHGAKSSFIVFETTQNRLQIAWATQDDITTLKDLKKFKPRIVAEIPTRYRALIEEDLNETTERQVLRITCDRLRRWHVPGMLFIGDAAHTMSPLAAQGISVALRDAVVAANHLIDAHRAARPYDSALLQRIEDERMPEVSKIQAMQVAQARLMFEQKAWKKHLALRLGGILIGLGLSRRASHIRQGITKIAMQYPVPA